MTEVKKVTPIRANLLPVVVGDAIARAGDQMRRQTPKRVSILGRRQARCVDTHGVITHRL